jgi:hypothetical protein
MASDRDDAQTPWWRTLPAMLTGAAGFVASIATVLALFLHPGADGGGDSRRAKTAPGPASHDAIAVSTVALDGRSPDPISATWATSLPTQSSTSRTSTARRGARHTLTWR